MINFFRNPDWDNFETNQVPCDSTAGFEAARVRQHSVSCSHAFKRNFTNFDELPRSVSFEWEQRDIEEPHGCKKRGVLFLSEFMCGFETC